MLTIAGESNYVCEQDKLRGCPNIKIAITGNNNLVQMKCENTENLRGGV